MSGPAQSELDFIAAALAGTRTRASAPVVEPMVSHAGQPDGYVPSDEELADAVEAPVRRRARAGESLASTPEIAFNAYAQRYRLLSAAQERGLARQLQLGSYAEREQARQQLILSNLRLVSWMARKHGGRGVDLEDLFHEGVIGLMSAVEKFDPDRGFRFATYASWWIRQALGRAVDNQARTIRWPVHALEELSRIRRTWAELEISLLRPPTPLEIASELHEDGDLQLLAERIESLLLADTPVASLDVLMESWAARESVDGFAPDDDEPGICHDCSSDEEDSPDDMALGAARRESVKDVLDSLNGRERRVLELRYGIDDGRKRTLEEVGREFGLTRERVRQVEAKAFRKLKHPSRARQLRGYL